ncbi:acetylornithine aminotransferase [Cyathus striatus]|nr:acetylornithine aminotransferase [Cyathus striatus]
MLRARRITALRYGAHTLRTSHLRTISTLKTADGVQSLFDFGAGHTYGIARITSGVVVKSQGSYVWYDDGRKMLDFTSGIGVTNLGHIHPKVSKAAAEQCMKVVHSQCAIGLHEPYARLIERLLPIMPHPSLDSFFFWNSGSEAVEGAIKMARAVTGKQNIICMQGAYHGRTYGAMAVTKSKTSFSTSFAPLMPGAYATSFPYFHQLSVSPTTSDAELTRRCLYDLDVLFSQQTDPSDVAAIIVEPILGEGGYIPAPPEFLKGLREICDKSGILLIVDEVQSGFGRAGGGTGNWWAIDESGVKPDILVLAKGLGNGFPISGVISRKELTEKLKPGSMGGTYAGNAVACAAAVAVVDAFHEENILSNVQARSKDLLSALKGLQSDPTLAPHILDIRGRGLMIGIEFSSPAGPLTPHDPLTNPKTPKNMASRVVNKCIEKGMLILTAGVYEVVRFIPPLNISEKDLLNGVEIFEEAVREVVREG